jgi:2-keto-4-pentenoate hydratase/2-oxohepta-3-ene-1,7-dioic acid hydratase in catechol pathway
MKLVSFRDGSRDSYGALVGDKIADFGKEAGAKAPTLKAAIAQNLLATLNNSVKPEIPLASVKLLPVIPNADKVLCVGLNYKAHVEEAGRSDSKYPVMFTRFNDSHVGANEPMLRPKVSTHFDYEGELAVIIGKPGRYIAKADALKHVAGYSCYNDGSIRDWQGHTHQFIPGKNFPSSGSYGPWMVTADEIPDPSKLTLITRLNGQEVQRTTTDLMIFPIPELIEYISGFTTLNSGDVIATGTPGGVGFKRKPPLYMKAGDVVEVDISSVGVLKNPIVDEK